MRSMASNGNDAPRIRSTRKGLDENAVAAAAFELFGQQGYDATSLDQVAKSLGVTKAAIFYHHAGKEAILQYGLNAVMSELEGVLEEGPAQVGAAPPLKRFLYVLRRGCDIGLARRSTVGVLLRLKGNSELERILMDRRRAFDRALTAILQEAVDAGELRVGTDVAVLERLAVGLVNSLVEWNGVEHGRSRGEVIEIAVGFAQRALERA